MRRERQYFVYILASRPYGTLYVGVTRRPMLDLVDEDGTAAL